MCFPSKNWTSKSGDISVSSSLSCEAGASGVSPSRPSNHTQSTGETNWININQSQPSQPAWINQTILEILQTYLSTSPGLNFEPTKRAPKYLITYQVKPYCILNFPWPSSSFLDLFRSKAVVSLLGKPSKFPICSRLICCPWKIRESPAVLLPWTWRNPRMQTHQLFLLQGCNMMQFLGTLSLVHHLTIWWGVQRLYCSSPSTGLKYVSKRLLNPYGWRTLEPACNRVWVLPKIRERIKLKIRPLPFGTMFWQFSTKRPCPFNVVQSPKMSEISPRCLWSQLSALIQWCSKASLDGSMAYPWPTLEYH